MTMERGPERAIGLRWDEDVTSAPEVAAAGSGEVARRILEAAAEHGIPVREDPELCELLALLDVGDEIPVELYTAVAELLVYLYRLSGETRA